MNTPLLDGIRKVAFLRIGRTQNNYQGKKLEENSRKMRESRERWLAAATPQQIEMEQEIASSPIGIPIKYLPRHLQQHDIVIDDLTGHHYYLRSATNRKLYSVDNERFWDTKDPSNIDIRTVDEQELEEYRKFLNGLKEDRE